MKLSAPIVSICALVSFSGTCGAAVIGFDDLPGGTIVTDQYQSLGVIFSGNFQVFGPSASTNAISPSNSVGFYHPQNQTLPYSISADFVLPGTGTPGVTDFVCFTPVDASNFNTIYTITAYNAANQVIGSASTIVESSGVYNPAEDPAIFLSIPGIARVTLGGSSPSGNMVIEGDDFVFNTPTPAPGTASVLGLVGIASLRRRR